jgi:hypothetical protein
MTQPKVTITELDGAIGVLPPSEGALYAVCGVSSSGPVATPATYARIPSLVADFGQGPGVEAAAYYIEKYGAVVFTRAAAETTAGAAGTVDDDDVDGTSVITADDTTTEPYDDYEVLFRVVLGGTIGTGPITFRYSLDGGRTMSPLISLGTANTYTIPNSGVTLDFAAGTLVSGDEATFRTSAPKWTTTEIAAAIDALKNSLVTWEIVHVVGDLAGADFDVVDPKFAAMRALGKFKSWVGNFRMPDLAESEATYLAAFGSAFNSRSTVYGEICAGAAQIISSVSARQYRRPISFAVAAREASVSHEVNIADVNLGSLPGVSLYDDAGINTHHDESLNPGLDDLRATVLRTHEGLQGVYVNRPRILSAEGSDFQLMPHRRVLNLAEAVLRAYFIRRLNKPIRVSRTTGFILEEEAREIEARATAALRSALLAKPKASGVQFVLSRTDNVLSTKTLTGDGRVIPLAYPEFINVSVGFLNPALQVVQV